MSQREAYQMYKFFTQFSSLHRKIEMNMNETMEFKQHYQISTIKLTSIRELIQITKTLLAGALAIINGDLLHEAVLLLLWQEQE